MTGAELIIASPFGRAIHSAAILSKELNIEMRVETDLHEWLADADDYKYLLKCVQVQHIIYFPPKD